MICNFVIQLYYKVAWSWDGMRHQLPWRLDVLGLILEHLEQEQVQIKTENMPQSYFTYSNISLTGFEALLDRFFQLRCVWSFPPSAQCSGVPLRGLAEFSFRNSSRLHRAAAPRLAARCGGPGLLARRWLGLMGCCCWPGTRESPLSWQQGPRSHRCPGNRPRPPTPIFCPPSLQAHQD